MDKPKFNFLDGIIILLVILIALAGVYILRGKTDTVKGPEQNCTAEFKMHLTRVDEDVFNKFSAALEEGESVWVGIKERFEGKIENVELLPSKRMVTDQRKGKAVMASDPTTNDVVITVSTSAIETASDITSQGTAIRVGEETAIRAKGVAGYGYIVELNTTKEQAGKVGKKL